MNDFKDEYPKMPDSFHIRLSEVVNEQVMSDDVKLSTKNKVSHISWKKVFVLSVAAIMMVGGTVFASDQIIRHNKQYSKDLAQTGDYAYNMDISGQEDVTTDENKTTVIAEHSANFHVPVKLVYNYMIDGYVGGVSGLKYSYNGKEDGKGRHFTVCIFQYDDMSQAVIDNITSMSEIEINGNKAYWMYANDLRDDGYNRHIIIFNDDFGYATYIYVGCGISDEEIMKVAEGMEFIPCDENVATSVYDNWVNPNRLPNIAKKEREALSGGSTSGSSKSGQTTTDGSKFLSVGDTFNGMGKVINEDESGVAYTVENVTISDNISAIDPSLLGKSDGIKSVVDENGKLLSYTRKLVKKGDRVNTVDTMVSEQTVARKLVYVTVKIKNTTARDISSVQASLSLVCLKFSNGQYTSKLTDDGYEYFRNIELGGAITDAAAVDLGGGHVATGYTPLAAGEEKTVHMAYIVDADQTDNMVLHYKSGVNIDFDSTEDTFVKLSK